jgi:hypothetical protein
VRIRFAVLAAAAALATFAGAGRASAVGPPLSIPNQLESALALDKTAHTVTLPLYVGISHRQRVWFVLTESSDRREAVRLGVNGPRGVDNPQRQGLQSAVAGEGDPLNIIREEPECSAPTGPANCSVDCPPMFVAPA